MDRYETKARANGYIPEIEYNGEDDGVRNPQTGNWSEDWKGACLVIDSLQGRNLEQSRSEG